MKIRTKLILNYSVLSIILLLIFSVIVVLSYIRYRQHNFEIRLYNRAISSANLLLDNRNNIDSTRLKLIDREIVTAMDNLKITIYDPDRDVIYTNLSPSELSSNRIASETGNKSIMGIGYIRISFSHEINGRNCIIEASAFDNYGANELKSLIIIIIFVLILSFLLIISFGIYSAIWSLKPFKRIIKEVEEIDPGSLSKRVSVSGNDEISQLARTFNRNLDRIEQAFETEKSFVSNAAHELHTPVTSVMGQIEVALDKARSADEYKNTLRSVYEDTANMAMIIDGFLDLADANLANNQIPVATVRIDEIIFSVIDDFERRKPNYVVTLSFKSTPETDTQLECIGNLRLLKLMFRNIVDNACKYSTDSKATIDLDFSSDTIIVSIVDHGSGIDPGNMDDIFKPLYRGANSIGHPGHGIGLAIVKKIADLHHAVIEVKSDLNIGTKFTVILRNKSVAI